MVVIHLHIGKGYVQVSRFPTPKIVCLKSRHNMVHTSPHAFLHYIRRRRPPDILPFPYFLHTNKGPIGPCPRNPFTQAAYAPDESKNDALANGNTDYVASKKPVFFLWVQERICYREEDSLANEGIKEVRDVL